jgi:hypothetical protein
MKHEILKWVEFITENIEIETKIIKKNGLSYVSDEYRWIRRSVPSFSGCET